MLADAPKVQASSMLSHVGCAPAPRAQAAPAPRRRRRSPCSTHARRASAISVVARHHVRRPGGTLRPRLRRRRTRRAHVIVACFKTPKRISDGWDFASLLGRLGLSNKEFVGKVLVHLDDEYGARNPRTEVDWRNYCAMYVGWRHVFRNYWSEAWAARVARNHAMNCTALCGATSQPGPRVEWTPLGWSANWQPGHRARRSSKRAALIGFYGNEKYQLKPNRGALMARFERETGIKVERMLGKVGFGRGNASNYVRLMHDTRLCLQISGLSAECYRMYEALDAGCVPVLINQFGKETATQYRFLLGRGETGSGTAPRRPPPPFPWAESPADLKTKLEQLRDDENALNAVQHATIRWWNQSLEHVRGRVISQGRLACPH